MRPTPLGEVVTGLMKEHFADIVDLKFTNHMEAELDEIEKGKAAWRDVLAEFYGDFSKEMSAAEQAMDGVKLKFEPEALDMIVDKAIEYKLGARGLRAIVETVMIDSMFELPSTTKKTFTVTADYVLEKLQSSHYELNKNLDIKE